MSRPTIKLRVGFVFIELVIAIAVLVLVGGLIYRYQAHRTNSTNSSGSNFANKDLKDADAYFDASRTESAQVAKYAKEEADKIQMPFTPVVDEGEDEGCTIFPAGTIGGPRTVNCTYSYLRFYAPILSQTQDLTKLYEQARAAGWTESAGASSSRFKEFIANPNYSGAFPIDLTNPNNPHTPSPTTLRISILTGSQNSGFYTAKGFKKVAAEIKPGSYVIGYELTFRYVQASCHKCITNYPKN